MNQPRRIILISGKRKSGKDYISEKLQSELSDDNSCIVRISEPIKSYYAKKYDLSLHELMADGPYKEQHRLNMIKWSDDVRSKEPGYFCKAACNKAPIKNIWIVSDIRRKTDIKWFKENYGEKIKIVRISALEDTRKARGWIYTEGVDNVTSECDLDDFKDWDLEIENNDLESFENGLMSILSVLKDYT